MLIVAVVEPNGSPVADFLAFVLDLSDARLALATDFV